MIGILFDILKILPISPQTFAFFLLFTRAETLNICSTYIAVLFSLFFTICYFLLTLFACFAFPSDSWRKTHQLRQFPLNFRYSCLIHASIYMPWWSQIARSCKKRKRYDIMRVNVIKFQAFLCLIWLPACSHVRGI